MSLLHWGEQNNSNKWKYLKYNGLSFPYYEMSINLKGSDYSACYFFDYQKVLLQILEGLSVRPDDPDTD